MPIPHHAPPAAFLAEAERRFSTLRAALADTPEAPAANDRWHRDSFERAVHRLVDGATHRDNDTDWRACAHLAPVRKGARPTVSSFSIWCDGTTIDSPTGTAADFAQRWNALVDAAIASETARLTALKIG